MKKIFTKDRLFAVPGVFLVAVLPFAIFLKHTGYSLLTPEILTIFGLILGFAVLCGILMIPGRAAVRVFVFAAMAILVVDVQTDWITTVGLRLLLNVVFFGTLFWFLRRRLTLIILFLAGAMVLGTVVLPGQNPVVHVGEPGPRPSDNPDLPFVLHLVLDAHLGVEGIPAEFDPDGFFSSGIRDFYLDQSFALYGRAYSRYYFTKESLPNLLNFAASGEPRHFLERKTPKEFLLASNSWFDLLHEQGYRIHALETSFMSVHDPDQNVTNPFGDTRVSYQMATLRSIQNSDLTVSQKIPFILSTYFNRTYFLKMAGDVYSSLAFSDIGGAVGLPRWDLHGYYPEALTAMQMLDIFEEQLHQAGPGQAFFGHILLPHSPYGFDRDCRMELQPSKWLYGRDKTIVPRTNTPASRAERYPLYLEQMLCLQSRLDSMFQILKDKGLWENALIIVHGDHGSRICLWDPFPAHKDKLVAPDFMDCYSTLFAVKSPGIEAGYYRQLLPIDHLFTHLVRDGVSPDNPELEANPFVFLQNKDLMEKRAMPPFAHGWIGAASP